MTTPDQLEEYSTWVTLPSGCWISAEPSTLLMGEPERPRAERFLWEGTARAAPAKRTLLRMVLETFILKDAKRSCCLAEWELERK